MFLFDRFSLVNIISVLNHLLDGSLIVLKNLIYTGE
jgi:hypothetical protein